jgi:hypothetical protein
LRRPIESKRRSARLFAGKSLVGLMRRVARLARRCLKIGQRLDQPFIF